MDYLEKLKAAAGETITPLFERVKKLEKQRAAVLDRQKNERDDVERRAADLASFKAGAAEKLAKGTSVYREFQGRLRRLKLEAETAREALALLDGETAPAVERELAAAREKLRAALAAVCRAIRPQAEAKMAALIDGVVAEHDAFLDGCARLYQDHGLAFVPPPRYPGPRVEHARLAELGKHKLTSPAPYLAFSLPPAPAAAAPVDVNAQDAPQGEPTTAPDTGAKPEDAPAAIQGPDKDAQSAPESTNGERVDAQDTPDGVSEKGGTTPATFLTGAASPRDSDAENPDVDPAAPPDLDADAPPEN